jgi:hypothetical protein
MIVKSARGEATAMGERQDAAAELERRDPANPDR